MWIWGLSLNFLLSLTSSYCSSLFNTPCKASLSASNHRDGPLEVIFDNCVYEIEAIICSDERSQRTFTPARKAVMENKSMWALSVGRKSLLFTCIWIEIFFCFCFFFKSEVIWLQDFQNNKVEGFLCSDTLDSPIRLVKLSKSGVFSQAKDTLKHALLFPYSSADWHSAKPGEKPHEELKVCVKTQTHSDGFLTFFFYMLTPD